MSKKAGIVNVLATPYEVWTLRDTTLEEQLDLVNNHGLKPIEALSVKDKRVQVVATHVDAATRMLRERADIGLENHIDRALDASIEYRDLRAMMPQDEPQALTAYQGEFSKQGWTAADQAIQANGVEIADGQVIFHGGRWASDQPTFITSRPLSTSFCPQVALRNAEWQGKAYDADRVDLMVLRVKDSKTKGYAYSREGAHGNEKEVVFASGALLTRVRETHIADMKVAKVTEGLQTVSKVVPAYLVEVDIS